MVIFLVEEVGLVALFLMVTLELEVKSEITSMVRFPLTPFPEIVYTFPTPDNVNDTIYNSNKNGSCYKFKATEVACDKNTKKTPIYKNKKIY